jgi:hypothetical protein
MDCNEVHMATTLTAHVPDRQALAAQVVLFVRQRIARYTWTVRNTKISAEEIFQMMQEGDDIGYSAIASMKTSITQSTNTTTIMLHCVYREDMVQMQYVLNRIPSIINPIMRKYQSNHARVLQFHDWVVKNFRYDHTRSHYSAYAGLAKGTTVCNGYAMMFAYLCREANIPCQIAVGNITIQSGAAHAWNMVELDGAWYHIDTTWDSPESDSPTAYVPYEYYMLTDGEMAMTRKIGMQVRNKRTPSARTPYAEVVQRLCHNAHPHTIELEQIRMRTGLIYTEPRYTITDRKALLERVVHCIQRGLAQETVRYMVNTRRAATDMQWVIQHLPALYRQYARRIQATCKPYNRAGRAHSLVMMHFV